MLNLKDINWKKPGLFAAGVAFGTAGIKILTSDDAKKLYTNCTAAVLRAKSCVMKTATSVQENAGDILAEAKQINEDRVAEAEAEVVDDFARQKRQQKILLKQQKNKNPALKIKKSCRKYIDTGTCGTSAGAFVRLARGDKSEI